jgi:hypothetical protein
MKVFKTKSFGRFARKEALEDAALLEAAANAAAGRLDADLGGGVIKKRVARKGGGKSGGFRTIFLFRSGTHVFFVFGFAKSERANISKDELAAFRKLAVSLLTLGPEHLESAIEAGELIEVTDNDKANDDPPAPQQGSGRSA